jgi:ankyrin repeat protein
MFSLKLCTQAHIRNAQGRGNVEHSATHPERRACRSIAHTCCGCQLAPNAHRSRVSACAALTDLSDHISSCSAWGPAILAPAALLSCLSPPHCQNCPAPRTNKKMQIARMRLAKCVGAVAVQRSGASRSLVGMRSRVVHCRAHWPSPAALGLALGLGAAGGVAACEKPVPNRALWEAALRGDPREVVQRIDEGAQPDGYVDENGVSALIAAAHQGHANVVEVLLDEGAAPDQQAPKGSSALMAASGEGHVSVVKVLLDGGANPDLLNANGVSALIWACSKGHLGVVTVLLERGAKVNHQDKGGVTALMAASVLGHFEVVKVLLEHGARTDLKDIASRTALDFAQRKAVSKMEAKKTLQKEATARLLLEHGAKSD